MPFRFALAAEMVLAALGTQASAAVMRVEEAVPGGRRVVLAFEDSVVAPNLGSVRLEGHSIEHAVFLEESDSLEWSSDLWDLTAPAGPKLIAAPGDSGHYFLDAPQGFFARPGTILADTAEGGLLAKVVESRPIKAGPFSTRYLVKIQPAFLNEALLEGEIRFRLRSDFSTPLPDHYAKARLEAQDSGEGEMEVDLRRGRVLFQPNLSGTVRVRNGLLELIQLRMQGELEASGVFAASARGQGRFAYEKLLGSGRALSIPLGHGLCLRLKQSVTLRVEAAMGGEEISAGLGQRLRQSVSADLIFNLNRWQPVAEARDLTAESSELSMRGSGSLRFALDPRLEFSVGGNPGPALVFSSSARVTGEGLSNAPVPRSRSALAPPAKTVTWRGSDVFFHAPSLSTSAAPRNFLLQSRERPWLGPPLEGWAGVAGGDTSGFTLQCRAEPKADYFEVQRLSPTGTWETVIPRAAGPLIRVDGMKSGIEQKFRLVGINAFGSGPAFPAEGLAYTPPLPVPPSPAALPTPLALGPDSVVRGDSTVRLQWSLVKPEAGGVFNVYFGNQDTLYPVAQSLRDTQFVITGLDSGWTYFWKVEYVARSRFSQSPLRHFTYHAPARPAPKPIPRIDRHGFVLIPGGSFLRADGRTVSLRPFYLQKIEVVQRDYRKVTGNNPSFHVNDSLPVERISWDQAAQYCRDLGGRLPTEAEWEYAARAGSGGRFFWGKSPAAQFARFRENSQNRTWPAASLKPNAFGLYDMAGNVFEWVQDWYGEYSPGDLSQPSGPASGTAKVIRGASWYSEAASLDLSVRFSNRPGFRNYKVGFRCAKDAPAPAALSAAGP